MVTRGEINTPARCSSSNFWWWNRRRAGCQAKNAGGIFQNLCGEQSRRRSTDRLRVLIHMNFQIGSILSHLSGVPLLYTNGCKKSTLKSLRPIPGHYRRCCRRPSSAAHGFAHPIQTDRRIFPAQCCRFPYRSRVFWRGVSEAMRTASARGIPNCSARSTQVRSGCTLPLIVPSDRRHIPSLTMLVRPSMRKEPSPHPEIGVSSLMRINRSGPSRR